MTENNNLQDETEQNITADQIEEDTTDIEAYDEEAVTPNDREIDGQNITRDTAPTAQEAVSEAADAEPFISVQYNHKNKQLTHKQAVNLIQKGMHTETLRTKLEYLADYYGVDVNTLVDKMANAPENEHRIMLESIYGKDSKEVEIGMQIYREKQSDTYKRFAADREEAESAQKEQNEIKNINSRLANEYLTLKSEIPDAPDYTALPDEVIIEAASGKRDLLSAYLCYLNREKIKIDAAKKDYDAAASASSKSMKSALGDNINSQERSFLSGLWSK